jgi:hypothetical protein
MVALDSGLLASRPFVGAALLIADCLSGEPANRQRFRNGRERTILRSLAKNSQGQEDRRHENEKSAALKRII